MGNKLYKLDKIRELIDEALTPEELDDICCYKFNQIYQEYYGKARSIKTRALVEYADSKGEMENLLRQIENKNLYCFDKYRHEIKDFKLIEIKDFDLKKSVEKSWDEIYGKKGIVGLSFACMHDSLIESFSERLEKRLYKKNQREVILCEKNVYRPQAHSANEIVKFINKKTRKLRKNNAAIFPIVVDEHDPSELLNSLQETFQNKYNFCLVIIIFFGNLRHPSISNDLITLDPKFKLTDLGEWIDDVTTALNTKQTTDAWTIISDIWKENAREYCDPHSTGNLNINSVYDHLEETQFAIQKDDAKILPKEFEEFLKKLTTGQYARV